MSRFFGSSKELGFSFVSAQVIRLLRGVRVPKSLESPTHKTNHKYNLYDDMYVLWQFMNSDERIKKNQIFSATLPENLLCTYVEGEGMSAELSVRRQLAPTASRRHDGVRT